QKYGELVASYGEDHVGLLTGDTTVRPRAPSVVMTTEVLRTMLLAGSDLLAGLQTVVLDEVHSLQDPYRGGVWEEVLVLSPPGIAFVCLSATVANATELGGWLRSVRGPTEVIVERRRPVVLRHHLAVHYRAARDGGSTELLPLLVDGRAGGEALRLDQAAQRAGRTRMPPHWRTSHRGGPSLPFRAPRRTELVEALDDDELLPAIVFIFSRAACDEAVRQCLRDGIRLTDHRQRAAVRQVVEAHVGGLADEDLEVLGYTEWVEGLEAGIAAHHAGLVPAYRETVEACFAAGLLKVVFATETLSLGINMPARSVAIERFTKFGGAGRAKLTSGEYAQLTGRAGRRGLDDVGHAVVLWSSETTAAEVARVAVAPPPDLRSAFRPTYNLAVNLVRRFDRPTATEVLRRSFAQWQAQAHQDRVREGGAPGDRRPPPDGLVEQLGRRLAVLEELHYVDGWRLTGAGLRLSRIYHEADLLVAEAVVGEVLDEAEPSVLAGVLSSLVFERRRARRPGGGGRDGRERRPRKLADRLGERRRTELDRRLAVLVDRAEWVRTLEEVHLAPRTRHPEPGLSGAVTSWARGASFGTVLEVAARDVGEIAPGDFVRTIKQLVDLVGQVSLVAPDPTTAAAAAAAVDLLRRGVVAAGVLPTASATGQGSPS
ncbi:MAG TPA: helicase-related protein, partial [Acidimicrobiales bacterium]|nr:helicase-related protein [Acidimicrobiales bacterium]